MDPSSMNFDRRIFIISPPNPRNPAGIGIDFIEKWLYTSCKSHALLLPWRALHHLYNSYGRGHHLRGGTILESIRLETSTRPVGEMQVLDVSGEIDVYTAPQFKEAVNQLINAGQTDLIINMDGVTYMDSSGFGTLLSATKRLRPEGGSVNLIACNSAIDRMLRITRLNTVFGTFATVDEAVAAVKDTKEP
jgi:anti-sigma B factor antagonist